jgi:hypothetical protein
VANRHDQNYKKARREKSWAGLFVFVMKKERDSAVSAVRHSA